MVLPILFYELSVKAISLNVGLKMWSIYLFISGYEIGQISSLPIYISQAFNQFFFRFSPFFSAPSNYGNQGPDYVDYGAYTGGYGAFGWYADHPVLIH
jgi:hypothetical protein